MSLLDRYVGRIALGAFGAALLFFVFLSILVHLLKNVGDYADEAVKRGFSNLDLTLSLAGYYLKLVPVVITTVTPFATVIACMFAVARLQHANEIAPMLFVGRSIQRILRPMLLLAVLAGALMAGCWQWVVPRFGADLMAHDSLVAGESEHKNVVHESPDKTQRFYAHVFRPASNTLLGVSMLVQPPAPQPTYLIEAKSASWDAEQRDWLLVDGRASTEFGDRRVTYLERPDLKPDVVLQQCRDTIEPDMLSYDELLAMSAARPNQASVRLAFHRHITWPLANVLLLLLVLPLAVHYERGSRIGRVVAAVALCGAYMLVDLVCQSLGQRNFFHPVVMAWLPAIFFGSLGVVAFGSARS